MKTIVLFTLLLLSTATLTCAQSPAALVGTYSVRENGQMNEFMKIERSGTGFTISEKQNGHWLSAKVVTVVSKSQLEKILGTSVQVPFSGLGNNDVALIKIAKGWRSGTFVCNTGYWLASMLGPIELYKN